MAQRSHGAQLLCKRASGVEKLLQIGQHDRLLRIYHGVQRGRQPFGHRERVSTHNGFACLAAGSKQFLKRRRAWPLGAARGQGVQGQGGAQHAFGVGAALFQRFVVQLVVAGNPQRCLHHLANAAAPRQFFTVLGIAAQRPQRQQRDLGLVLALHAKVGALGQGNQGAQHVGAGFGARQQRMRGEQLRCLCEVTARRILQMQTDEVDDALARTFQFGPQKLAAKVARYLHHALGSLRMQGGELFGPQNAVVNAVRQRALEKRACVVQGQRLRRCFVRTAARHQMADSSSEVRAAGVTLPRSVSLVSNLPSSSSSGCSSPSPRSCARALARSTKSISINRSRHS